MMALDARNRHGTSGAVLVLAVSLAAFGCTPTYLDQDPRIAIHRTGSGKAVCKPAGESAANILEYAAMASAAYRTLAEERSPGWRGARIRPEELPDIARCEADDLPAIAFEFPEWSEIEPLPAWEKRGSYHPVGGLAIRAWYRLSPDGSQKTCTIVLAFRGTQADEAGDWWSNFRWITRVIPWIDDQYDQVLRHIDTLVDHALGLPALAQHRNGCKIITVGHSLGGGLAQQAAYAVSKPVIKNVYAFAPSVVTGYYSADGEKRDRNESGMKIHRVYEHGEILAYLRWIFRQVYPVTDKDPLIELVRFNLERGGGVFRQHSMDRMTCTLAEAMRKYHEPAPCAGFGGD
jgi:hypothetical protein